MADSIQREIHRFMRRVFTRTRTRAAAAVATTALVAGTPGTRIYVHSYSLSYDNTHNTDRTVLTIQGAGGAVLAEYVVRAGQSLNITQSFDVPLSTDAVNDSLNLVGTGGTAGAGACILFYSQE